MRQLVRARCTRAALTTSTPAKGIDTSTHSDQMPVHNSPILVTRGVVEREWLLLIIYKTGKSAVHKPTLSANAWQPRMFPQGFSKRGAYHIIHLHVHVMGKDYSLHRRCTRNKM